MMRMRRARVRRFRRPRRFARTRGKRVFKKRVTRIAKGVALRNQETKFNVRYVPDPPVPQALSNIVNSAGGMYWGTVTKGISQGLKEEGNRVGNEITLKGTTFKMWIKPDFPEVEGTRYPTDMHFRFIVCKINSGNATQWTTAAEPQTLRFFETGGTANPALWHWKKINDRDGIVQKVYVDKLISLKWGNQQTYDDVGVVRNANAAQVIRTFHIDWHNMKFQYASGGTDEFGTKCDLIWLAIPFNGDYATATPDMVNWMFDYKTWYKDG